MSGVAAGVDHFSHSCVAVNPCYADKLVREENGGMTGKPTMLNKPEPHMAAGTPFKQQHKRHEE